jgi:hypothetical protein
VEPGGGRGPVLHFNRARPLWKWCWLRSIRLRSPPIAPPANVGPAFPLPTWRGAHLPQASALPLLLMQYCEERVPNARPAEGGGSWRSCPTARKAKRCWPIILVGSTQFEGCRPKPLKLKQNRIQKMSHLAKLRRTAVRGLRHGKKIFPPGTPALAPSSPRPLPRRWQIRMYFARGASSRPG